MRRYIYEDPSKISDFSGDELDKIRADIDKTAYFVVQYMIEKNLSVSTAESCTGGMLASAITSVPGASGIFECGIVSYSNRIKEKILGVSEETINNYGVVSAETSREMAERAMALSGSDISVGITGLAGPGGDGKLPEGTVYVTVLYERGDKAVTENLDLGSRGRRYIRAATVLDVLKKLENILSAL